MILASKVSGETSLQTLERIRREEGVGDDTPMTYAGTLDPMAEGVLPILVGEECKEKEKFSGTDKGYEVDILFGVSTDSDDILGLIKKASNKEVDYDFFVNYFKEQTGKKKQKYHPFSHKKIDGVPLFELAKQGKIKENELPENDVEIYSVDILGWMQIQKEELDRNICGRIGNLKEGDFRQEEILAGWRRFFKEIDKQEFDILKIHVKCSSGTYMRNLVRKIGVPALAFRIKRVKIDTEAF